MTAMKNFPTGISLCSSSSIVALPHFPQVIGSARAVVRRAIAATRRASAADIHCRRIRGGRTEAVKSQSSDLGPSSRRAHRRRRLPPRRRRRHTRGRQGLGLSVRTSDSWYYLLLLKLYRTYS